MPLKIFWILKHPTYVDVDIFYIDLIMKIKNMKYMDKIVDT